MSSFFFPSDLFVLRCDQVSNESIDLPDQISFLEKHFLCFSLFHLQLSFEMIVSYLNLTEIILKCFVFLPVPILFLEVKNIVDTSFFVYLLQIIAWNNSNGQTVKLIKYILFKKLKKICTCKICFHLLRCEMAEAKGTNSSSFNR